MRSPWVAAWVLARQGFGVGAGLRTLWRWLTGYTFVWQFAVVFAALSLVLFALTGFGLSHFLAQSIEDGEVDDAVEGTREHVSRLLMSRLSLEEPMTSLTEEEYGDLDGFVQGNIISADTHRVRIWGLEGTLLYSSDDPGQIGQQFPPGQKLAAAVQGRTVSRVADSPAELEGPVSADAAPVLAVYTPLTSEAGADVVAALEVHEAYAPIADRVERSQTVIYVAVAGAMGFLYAALLTIVMRVSGMASKQRRQLMVHSQELKRSHDALLQVLSAALDLRDQATRGRSLRVARLALAVGRELGLSEEELSHLEQAALLHDIGRIALPEAVLKKASPLSRDEWEDVQKHPERVYQMVRNAPFLREAGEIILCHHERYDGEGYPRGLWREQIPLGARIFSLADAYDAMISVRPYRKAGSHAAAVREIKANAGTQFDPKVTEAFLEANRKGLIRDKAFPQTEGEEGAVQELVASAAQGEEAHA